MRPSHPRSSYRNWIYGLLLSAVTLISYQPAWNGRPVWDDDRHMTRPELRSMEGLARIWTQPGATQQYYPLVHTVFWLEHRLWGDSPPGYHLLNILLHILSSLLLVKILRHLKVPGSWLAGAIFALHPVQVESVAWIAEMKNTLSGALFLSAALAYLKFDPERRRGLYALALGLFGLGLMSKSVIAILPVSLLVVFWWKRGRIAFKRDVVPLLPFFVLGIASGSFTAWMEHNFIIGSEGSEYRISILERCLIAGRAVWFYLGKILWPVDLMFIYPRWNVSRAIGWQVLFPLAALLLAGALWALRKRWRAPLAVFVYFTGTLFPALGFINVYPFRYSFVADHFQYLACIGPIVLLAAAAEWAWGRFGGNLRRFPRSMMYGIALLTLGLLTWKQSGMYADAETLYRTTLRKNPACWMAYNNLGALLTKDGRTDEAYTYCKKASDINPNDAEAHYNLGILLAKLGRTDEAVAQYQKALEIHPNDGVAHYNLGMVLAQTGRTDEAMVEYRKALEINPKYAEAYNNLGILLEGAGRTEEAAANYQQALEINPDYAGAHYNLGILLEGAGRTDEAILQYRRALETNPNHAEAHYNLGVLLAGTGRTEEAIAHFRNALDINPNLSEAHNNLGVLLAGTGRMEEAMIHYRKAVEISPGSAEAWNNLGNALLQTGRTGEAIVHYRKALEINPRKINALTNLASAFLQEGQRADAIQLLQEALALAKSAGDESQARGIAAKLEKLNQENRSSHPRQR